MSIPGRDGPRLAAPLLFILAGCCPRPPAVETAAEVCPEVVADSPPSHEVELILSADDAWEGWLDGHRFGRDANWTHSSVYFFRLPAGRHVLALRGWDMGAAVAGLIALVRVDGQLVARTGEGHFRASGAPPQGFEAPDFDDANWRPPQRCTDEQQRTWHGRMADEIQDDGARWVWARPCSELGETALRLELDIR